MSPSVHPGSRRSSDIAEQLTRSLARRTRAWGASAALLLAAATPFGAAAQQQPPPTEPTSPAEELASVPEPTGILVAPNGDVVVLSDAPAGSTLVRLADDGTKVAEFAAKADPPDLFAHSRIAWVESGDFKGAALVTPKGILLFFTEEPPAEPGGPPQLEAQAQVDLSTANKNPFTPRVDVDGGTPRQVALAGARFDDVAVAPALPTATAPAGAPPPVHVFITGATAEGTPFILRVWVDLATRAVVSSVLASSQATVQDPEHRSAIGIWTPRAEEQGAEPRPMVLASMPTQASRGQPGGDLDSLIAFGTTWPDGITTTSAPAIVNDTSGQPFLLSSSGMSSLTPDPEGAGTAQDPAGAGTTDRSLYGVVTSPECGEEPGPSVIRLDADAEIACAPLPATDAPETYVDVAGGQGAAYVTDQEGDQVLRLPSAPDAPDATSSTRAAEASGARSASGGAGAGALRRLGRLALPAP